MKKASSHRKRHLPPGPCGIWFQTQQQLSSSKNNDSTEDGDGNKSSQADDSNNRNNNRNNNAKVEDMSFSPAWTSMQQSLNIVTPYLPTWTTDSKQRYDLLRPHIPSRYVLLWEILKGHYDCDDFSMNDPNRLLVLVHSVESHIHHNTCTVELQDETGVTIRAWMEPKYVQEQILGSPRQQQDQSTIRPGVVWMLRKVGMIVVQHEEEKVERMLLISGKQIEQIWTPEQAAKQQEQDEDSPRSQRNFLDWMEKRKAIPSTLDRDDEEQLEESKDNNREDNDTTFEALSRVANEQEEEEEEYPNNNQQDGNEDETGWVQMLLNQQQQQKQRRTHDGSQSMPSIHEGNNNAGEHSPSEDREISISRRHESRSMHSHLQQQNPPQQPTEEVHPNNESDAAVSIPGGDDPMLCSQQAPKTRDASLVVKRRDRGEDVAGGSIPEAASDESRTHTKRHKTKQSDLVETETQSSQPRERREATIESKSTSFCSSQQESNVWDQVQDASVLDMLDDDEEEDHIDHKKSQDKSSPHPPMHNEPSSGGTESTCQHSAKKQRDDTETTQTQTPHVKETHTMGISVFDSSNLEAFDFSEFSDDE